MLKIDSQILKLFKEGAKSMDLISGVVLSIFSKDLDIIEAVKHFCKKVQKQDELV